MSSKYYWACSIHSHVWNLCCKGYLIVLVLRFCAGKWERTFLDTLIQLWRVWEYPKYTPWEKTSKCAGMHTVSAVHEFLWVNLEYYVLHSYKTRTSPCIFKTVISGKTYTKTKYWTSSVLKLRSFFSWFQWLRNIR